MVFGVMGEGHSGSDLLMIPMGREFIMFEISKRTFHSCANVNFGPATVVARSHKITPVSSSSS